MKLMDSGKPCTQDSFSCDIPDFRIYLNVLRKYKRKRPGNCRVQFTRRLLYRQLQFPGSLPPRCPIYSL